MEGLAVEDGDVVGLAPAAVSSPVGSGGGGGGGGGRPGPAVAAAAAVVLLADYVGDGVEVHLAHVVLPVKVKVGNLGLEVKRHSTQF